MKDDMSKQRYCSYCGTPIDHKLKECLNCGKKYGKSKRFVAVICALLCVILFAAGGYCLVKYMPSRQPDTLSAEKIYQLASPATVEISVETEYGTATGTGFFDGEDGTIITNFHVIEDATSGYVYLSNGEKYQIQKLIGYDAFLDVAIIQINYQPTQILQKQSELLQTGATVYALGSSLGLSDSFSQGIVSANQREIDGHIFIQTTTPISHGNSGGPLIDEYGKVVGITTAGIETGQNLNLAVPIANVTKIDRGFPVNFPGKITIGEEAAMELSGLTYWEWAKKPTVICNTENHQYHDGKCFEVYSVSYREDNHSGKLDSWTILEKSVAIESGYTQCITCKVSLTEE